MVIFLSTVNSQCEEKSVYLKRKQLQTNLSSNSKHSEIRILCAPINVYIPQKAPLRTLELHKWCMGERNGVLRGNPILNIE